VKTRFAFLACAALVASAAGTVFAQAAGTEAEARAMLDKAVAALKTDKAKALDQFAKGEGGFKDRDLYPFCGGADGNFTAHPALTGKSMKELKDKNGEAMGAKMYAVAQEGKIEPVAYMWPKPGGTDPVSKVSLVTKIGDQVCGVGYYK
jgi:signal transduction histidine kinase